MKKTKIFLLLVLGFIVGAMTAIGVYFLTVGEVAWQEYVETKLVPNIVFILTAIGTIGVAATPIINRVQATLQKFDKATEDVNDTVEKGRTTAEQLKLQDERIADLHRELDELKIAVVEEIQTVHDAAVNTEQIVRIAFCNTEELVNKGYATEIAKVGANDEKETKS